MTQTTLISSTAAIMPALPDITTMITTMQDRPQQHGWKVLSNHAGRRQQRPDPFDQPAGCVPRHGLRCSTLEKSTIWRGRRRLHHRRRRAGRRIRPSRRPVRPGRNVQSWYSIEETLLWSAILMLGAAPISGCFWDRFEGVSFSVGGMVAGAASFVALLALPAPASPTRPLPGFCSSTASAAASS